MDDEESLVGQRRVKSPLSQTEKIVIGFCLGFIGVLLFIMMISVLSISSSMPESTPTSATSSDSHTKPMLDRSTLPQCQPPVSPSRKIAGHKPVLLRNAKLLIGDLDGTERFGFDLLMVDGKIKQIAKGITAPPDSIIIDTKNAFVSPGIVDMHSHAGVDSFPDTFGTRDVNEATSPATPGIRVIDAYNPHDPALTDIVKGGVTTIQVLPGSANTMGGQGAVFKVWPRSSGRASLEHAHVPTADVRLKMACGENPKRVYGRSRHQTPASRMGSAWVMRMKLAEAAKLKREQDKWCAVTDVDNHDDYPTDLTLEPLVQLLRGHGVLNVHCYKTVDMNMMLRLKEEFNFRIASFHHAHESFELAARLARENITAALFADNYAYKMEASEGRADAPVILDAAGARVAIKSDHPVLDAGNMMMQASVAAHFGLPQARALAAVTSVPADAIGLGASLGTLSEGKHADVVVWDRHPLATGARPTKVFIEGVEVVTAPKDELPADTSALDEPPQPPKFNGTQFQKAIQTQLCGQTPQALWLRNARLFSMQDANSANDGKIGSVVVGSDGKVMCVEFGQNACTAMGVNALKVDLDDDEYFIVPAWINADAQTRLGDEILSEATGVDGEAGDDGIATVNSMERWKVSLANGGYRGSTRVARNLVADGMLSAVRAPAYLGVVGGVGSLMRVGDGWFGEELKADGDGLLLDENVGLHVQIGADAKRAGSIENAVSGQLTLLETALSNSTAAAAALGADRGVFVRAHHADDILAVLRLAKRLPAYRFVLVGGAEAHLVATQLAEANMPAVLSPARCRRQSFDRMRCEHDRVRALVAAGVKLSFSMPSADELRGTRMRVGHEWQRGRLSERQALAGLTSNVADTYKLTDGSGRIVEGESARLVVFHRHPLLSGSRVALAVDRRRRVCAPGEAPFIGFENYKGVV